MGYVVEFHGKKGARFYPYTKEIYTKVEAETNMNNFIREQMELDKKVLQWEIERTEKRIANIPNLFRTRER